MPTRNTAVLNQIIEALDGLLISAPHALARLENHFKDSLLVVAGDTQLVAAQAEELRLAIITTECGLVLDHLTNAVTPRSFMSFAGSMPSPPNPSWRCPPPGMISTAAPFAFSFGAGKTVIDGCQRDTLLEAFRANRPNVLAEHGCIEYAATVDSQPTLGNQTPFGPDSFVVIEKWESVEALQAHFSASHMKAYGEETRDLVASRVIHVLEPV